MASPGFPIEYPSSQSKPGSSGIAFIKSSGLTEAGHHILYGRMVDYPRGTGDGSVTDYSDKR
jgi:hypothetical protein